MIESETRTTERMRMQGMFQLPGDAVVPYIALGGGVARDDGSMTGSPHVGLGARVLIGRSLTLRLDTRSVGANDTYHVELTGGVSFPR